MIRFGLCCVFYKEPIAFKRATAKFLKTRPRRQQLRALSDICLHNAHALFQALQFCCRHGIKCFRINSAILPLKTHPEVGYALTELPDYRRIVEMFKHCGTWSRRHDLRTTFHPDQFIVLSSPDRDIVRRSVAELAYHARVAGWVNADVINVHGGGAYGDKRTALQRLAANIKKLPERIAARLTLENDDRVYSPQDLLPVCADTGVPLVYDVHHHRCLPDGKSVEETTGLALRTWNREPLFHVSSPLHPWGQGNPRMHHDYIKRADFPKCWRNLAITVEIEAKAKEAAIAKLQKELAADDG